MRPVLLFLLATTSVFAQPFSAGIKGGVPLTDLLETSQNISLYNASNQHYVIGGVAELRLPLGFGVEFDALYRHLQISNVSTSFTLAAGGGNWEFPLLLKYRFHFPVVRPYVDAGVAWDTLTGIKQAVELQRNTVMGYVAGFGVDIHAIVLHISPEIRYTRWSSQQVNVVQSSISVLQTNPNQAEFLVGITF